MYTMADATEAKVLTLDVDRTGDVAVVRLHGKLKFGVNDVLYSKVSWLIPQSKCIVLDLTDLAQMDSTGLGTLVRLYVSAKSHGCELQLIHLRQRIRELLALTNMLSVFTVIGEQGVKII
jgi:anti-sigma B factor antagonist